MEPMHRAVRVSRREALGTVALMAASGLARDAGAQTQPMDAEQMANVQVVADFIAAWNARDAAKVASYLAADARFSAGRIGAFAPLRPPVPLFNAFIAR